MSLEGKLQITGLTDTGLVRSHNEDSIQFDSKLGLAVLADGMGGHNAGEIASAIAIDTIQSRLEPKLKDIGHGELDEETGYSAESILVKEAVAQANDAILTTASEKSQYKGMGTTLVVALFYDNRMTVANVGDSRLYRFRGENLEQITVDHTLLQELVDRGFYTLEEARETINRNVVTRALGIEPAVTADLHEELVLPGDIYLLCSDGLNDMAEDEDILSILIQFSANLDEAKEKLVQLAKDNGGKDNISVILCRPTQPFPAEKGWFHKIIDWFS